MSNGQLLTIRQRYSVRVAADAQLAFRLPELLGVPRMNEAARAAFRAVLDYEQPSGNLSLVDFLVLAQARGFCAHPSDWVPNFNGDAQHPALYQPWVDWLSENGLTPFHEGNTLTQANWDRWKPRPRLAAFRALLRKDHVAAYALLQAVGSDQPAATRLALLQAIDAGGSFFGNYPHQVPVLRHFLGDPAAKVRAAAEEKLKAMDGLETEAAHAAELAMQLSVSGGVVKYASPPAPHTSPFWKNYACATFDLLAKALGLSPQELARQCDLGELGSNFLTLVVLTADVEARSIVASRVLDMNEGFATGLFRGVARPLWERGLRATFASEYYSSVEEFLGMETGTLDRARMRELLAYKRLEQTVANEVADGKLPVNIRYDPLRALGLVVDKEAAGGPGQGCCSWDESGQSAPDDAEVQHGVVRGARRRLAHADRRGCRGSAGDSLLFAARGGSQLPEPFCGKKVNCPRHQPLERRRRPSPLPSPRKKTGRGGHRRCG